MRTDCIVTADGREHPVEAIVLATGFAVGLASAPFRSLASAAIRSVMRGAMAPSPTKV